MIFKKKYIGIDWLGEIPLNWSYCRFKDVVNLYVGNSIKDEDKDNYCDSDGARSYVSSKDLDLTFNTINYDTGLYVKLDDSNFRIAPKFSTLMCIEGGSAGRKKAITLTDVSFVNKLCCFVPKNNDLYYEYLYYFLCSPNYEDYFFSQMTGLIGGVTTSKLKDFNILLPPIEEQKNICKFLNKSLTPINQAIDELLSLIEKYREYKQSVITEIICTGLNKNVEMKDSKVDWIGKIPEHWETDYLKHRVVLNRLSLTENTDDNYEFNYVDIGSVSFEKGIEKYETMLFKDAPSRARRVVKKDDVIISTVRTYLKAIAIIPDENDIIVSTGFAVLTPTNINPRYLGYVVKSEYFINLVSANSVGVLYPTINSSKLINFKIVIPPNDEQEEIANYLDEKTQPIDFLIDEKEKLINKLEEYKKSLIFEYVTGKKEVPK